MGVASVSYSRRTGTLKFLPKGGNLHWCHVHHCAGIINNGDATTISASYTGSLRQVITSRGLTRWPAAAGPRRLR